VFFSIEPAVPPRDVCRGRPGALISHGRALSRLYHSADLSPWKKVTCAHNPVCARACMPKPTTCHEETGWCVFVPTNKSPLLQKKTNAHIKQGPRTHTQSTLCSITLLEGLTKSARIPKHANETRAGAVNTLLKRKQRHQGVRHGDARPGAVPG